LVTGKRDFLIEISKRGFQISQYSSSPLWRRACPVEDPESLDLGRDREVLNGLSKEACRGGKVRGCGIREFSGRLKI
jgi:hypothetical protein